MFYSVLALQVKTGKASSKHSGMIALFDEHFVKPGIFSKDLSKTLHRAFDLRQMSDYRELFEIDKKEAEDCLNDATIFVSAVKNYFK